MKPIVVAVDGPAGSGKSTVSRHVAVLQGLDYLDSGALYRSVTWALLGNFGSIPDRDAIEAFLPGIRLRQEFRPHEGALCITWCNERDVTGEIRDEAVAAAIGPVSDTVAVRDFINDLLREWSRSRPVIMDGRDIGSVVFPHADLKIYLDASVEVRTARRVAELVEQGKNVDESDIRKQIIQRDRQDRERVFGALVRTEDAVSIDTSDLTREQVIAVIADHIDKLRR